MQYSTLSTSANLTGTSAVHAAVMQALPGTPIANTPDTPISQAPGIPLLTIPNPTTGGQPVHVQNVNGIIHYVQPTGGTTYTSTQRQVPFVGTPVLHQYDIVALRTGVHFGILGYVIGASDEIDDEYATPLSLIPSNTSTTAGLTCTVSFVAGKLVFSYTDGTNIDTVTLSCTQMSMANFLNKLKIKKYSVPTTRCSWSDSATSQTAFGVSILNYKRRESGGILTDPLSFISNQTPYQLTIQKVDVNKQYCISREEAFAGAIIAVAGATLTHSLQVEETQAFNVVS